jgi:hypothetical protein
MAQPVCKLQVILGMQDLTLDPISFGLHYERETGTSLTPDEANGLAGNLAGTLTAGTGAAVVASYFPISVNHALNGCDVKGTDVTAHLDGTPAGSPIADFKWTCPTGTTGSPMPEGVAGVLSYRGDYGMDPEFVRDPVTHKVTGRPRSSDRNRLYLPLNANALTPDPTTGRAKISGGWITAIGNWLNLITTLSDSIGGTGNTWKWVGWSRKLAKVFNVVGAFVDDRPDYQRRRTDPSPTRTKWTVTETGLWRTDTELGAELWSPPATAGAPG